MKIIDNAGNEIHKWDVDIFKLFPDLSDIPESRRPKSRPGGELHGLVFLPNGDIVFNLEPVGLLRMNYCGQIVWRQPYPTHHSVHLDESGNFYVSGHIYHEKPDPKWPDMKPEFLEDTVLEVSPDGKILDEISVFDLLKQNNEEALLYNSSRSTFGAEVTGDILHLNDVESFPSRFKPGVFQRGDLLISLHSADTIIVFNQATRKIKYLYSGAVIWQHDPDFISGNEISILDNHSLAPSVFERSERPKGVSSRIVILDARDSSTKVYFEGSKEIPFFSDIMGKHQWLPNGNLLITEARWGRVFEITPEKKIAWEFNNVLKHGFAQGLVGAIAEGQRLAPEFDGAMFERLDAACRTG